MRVPVSLPLGGRIIVVHYPDVIVSDDATNSKGDYGESDAYDGTVLVARKIHTNEPAVWSTLLHELLHVALGVSGHSCQLAAGQEEGMVTGLENCLASILYLSPDNKSIKWREIEFPFEV